MAQARSERNQLFVGQQPPVESSRQPLALYHLSHDLRGPLNSILGLAELLREGIEGPLNENQQEDITAIYRSAKNLLHLINSVVDLSKLEADQLKFELGSVNLNEVIEKIIANDFGLDEPGQIELVSTVTASLPPLAGDRSRIEQMIMNLVRFGHKVKKEGQVTIAAERSDQEVTIALGLRDITLSDEQMSGLFELAVDTDAVGRSELGLGGLELPLAQLLAKQQCGQLWVESNEGSGATFYLKLPVHGATDQSRSVGRSILSQFGNEKTVT